MTDSPFSVFLLAGAASLAFTLLSSPGAAQTTEFDPAKDRGQRVGYETLGYLAGTGVGVLAGGGIGALTGLAMIKGNTSGYAGLVPLIMGGVGAIAAGFAGGVIGVHAAGQASGGNGTYWGSLAGGGLGVVTGLGIIGTGRLIEKHTDFRPLTVAMVGLGVLAFIAGPIIGYELTTHSVQSAPRLSQDFSRFSPVTPAATPQLNWSMTF